jgi:hypothetical protein
VVVGRALAGLLAAALAAPQGTEVDWPAVWSRLAAVRTAAPGAPGRADGVSALRSVARERRGTPRGALLQAHLERLEDEDAVLELPSRWVQSWPFQGPESWLVSEVLPPSPQRALAAQRAIESTPGAIPDDRLRLAWGIGVDEARALHLVSARDLQEALYRRVPAVWSATDLSLTLSRLGEAEAADRILAEQIEREAAAGHPTGDLWSRRGTQALGNGDEGLARDYLGLGLARGSADAGVVLARLDLVQGRIAEACAGFRALLLDPAPSPWAARGWGLTLLPSPSPDRSDQAGDR